MVSWQKHLKRQVTWKDGKKFEDKFVETLLKYGYKGKYLSKKWRKQPLFIQSFAPNSLVYMSNLTDSPLVFLIDDVTTLTQDTNQVRMSLGFRVLGFQSFRV
jgi:glycerophosphoryl diester phosphodiesterase